MMLLTLKPIVEEATRMSFESPSPSTPTTPVSSTTASPSVSVFERFSKGQEEHLAQLQMFLDRLPICSPKIVDAVTNILPFLTYGEQQSVEALINFFASYLDWESYDRDPDQDKTFYLNSFVNVLKSTPNDAAGHLLKSQVMDHGITAGASTYLANKFTDNNTGSYQLSSVPYVLEVLTGLCSSHNATINYILSNNPDFLVMLHHMEEVRLFFTF